MRFAYTARDATGQIVRASLDAATRRDAMRVLAARGLQVVFITVDPERDTAKALAAYLASPSFPKATIGLTGTAAQVAAVARAYHVFYQKAPEAGGGYTMDHSSVVYLMDRGGRFIRPLDVSLPPPEVARQLRTALAGG